MCVRAGAYGACVYALARYYMCVYADALARWCVCVCVRAGADDVCVTCHECQGWMARAHTHSHSLTHTHTVRASAVCVNTLARCMCV